MQKLTTYIVYETTNLINGKFYIGVHKVNKYKYYGSGYLLKAAIKKYGKENFMVEILKEFTDKQAAYLYEKQLVTKKLVVSHTCYNIRTGGYGFDGMVYKGKDHYLFGKKVSKEICLKISKNHPDVSGKNNPMYGRKRSQKLKDAVSKAHKGIKLSSTVREKMRLGQLKRTDNSKKWVINGKLFNSSREAGKFFNTSHSSIRYWCNTKVPLCYSF